jgi:glucose/arabinose dehydrogenase
MASRVGATVAAASAVAVLLGVPVSTAAPVLRLIPYASGFTLPIGFFQDPTDSRVQFVLQQGGVVRTLVNGAVQPTPFLDMTGIITSGGERGLLGLAFPPDAATSGRLYVDYTNLNGDTVVARLKRSANPLVVDRSTLFPMTWSTGAAFIAQPFANHNGGNIAFGPDGYLYIGMGDGGSGDDPMNNAQNPASLLGKILRIDASVGDGDAKGFRVPADNPFVSNAAFRPEIWDIGVRNPWRFSFDDIARGGTGALIIGDVGQNAWEEIDYEPRGSGGENYGWRNREGANAYIGTIPPTFLPMTDPIYQYDHTVGNSITGGFLYRGSAMPTMRGRYFFADYVRSRIWSAAVTVNGTTQAATISDVVEHTNNLQSNIGTGNISTFGLNSAGELFVVDYARGVVHRFTQVPSAPTGLRIIR